VTSPFSPHVKKIGPCELHPLRVETAPLLAAALATMDPWLSLGYTSEALTRYLMHSEAALHRFEIRVEGKTAGAVSVRDPWLRGPYLELFGIFQPWQGVGVGKAVLGWFTEGARQRGGNAWALVSSENAGARRFYRREGFCEIAPLPGLVAEGNDEILLRKQLK
jgi:ribosomal protein S18 acetylase RimI-like enzyme